MKMKLISIALITVALGLIGSGAFAIDEGTIISSAEQVTAKWEKLLSGGINLVWFHPGDEYWHVDRHTLIPGSLAYDVKKTDSLVSPYILVMTFRTSTVDNTNGPNANGIIKSTKRKGGYKSAEDALAHVAHDDFTGKAFQGQGEMKANYALQKDTWILKGGNDRFNLFIGQHLRDKENEHLFKDVLAVSAQ